MPHVPNDALRQVQEALERYEKVVEDSCLKRSTRDTYIVHARNFVRWLDDDFEPGGTLKSQAGAAR